ncbi:MAG: hypothetical protein ABI609_12755 [Acidobacteriota bacterium]
MSTIQRYLSAPWLMDAAKLAYCVPWAWRRLLVRTASFVHDGREYPYFSHPYNATWRNERAIEIPLIMPHVTGFEPMEVLEVGNVLSHYFPVRHLVVDRYERRRCVLAGDIVGLELPRRFRRIVSISTLEHVGWDERPRVAGKHRRAIASMRRLLATDGQLIATIPMGYNPGLDDDLLGDRLGCAEVAYFKRSRATEWRAAPALEMQGTSYGKRFRAADGLALCKWSAA